MRQGPPRSGGARPASSPLLYLQLSCLSCRGANGLQLTRRVHLPQVSKSKQCKVNAADPTCHLSTPMLSRLARCLVLLFCVKNRSTNTCSVPQDCSKVTASFGLPPSRSRLWCSVCAKQVIDANRITSCRQLSLTAFAVGVAVSWRNTNDAHQL